MKRCILILLGLIILNNKLFSVSTYTIVFPNAVNINCSPGDTLKFYGNTTGNFEVYISNATGTISTLYNNCTTSPYYIGYATVPLGSYQYLFYNFSNAYTGTITCALSFPNNTGIANYSYEKYSFDLYPNPANDKLNIELSTNQREFTKAQIINSLGVLVKETDLIYNETDSSINVADLPNGVYILNLKVNSSSFTSKRFTIAK